MSVLVSPCPAEAPVATPLDAASDRVPFDCPLSGRELEVLRLASRGRSNREIGLVLGISPRTVQTYLDRVFQKLDAGNRVEASVIAARRGWA